MVDIQTVSIAIASASVVVGVVYYALQIRHQTRIRKTDLIIRLYSRLHSNEFDDAYPKIMSLEFRDYEDFAQERYFRFFFEQSGPAAAEKLCRSVKLLMTFYSDLQAGFFIVYFQGVFLSSLVFFFWKGPRRQFPCDVCFQKLLHFFRVCSLTENPHEFDEGSFCQHILQGDYS